MGIITKIDRPKVSRSEYSFTRVYFQIVNPTGKTSWAKTDLVGSYRNFPRWEPLLREGNKLQGLRMKDKSTVDADSYPVLLEAAPVRPPQPTQGSLL